MIWVSMVLVFPFISNKINFIARCKKEIYASKMQFANKRKGNESVRGLVVLEKVTAPGPQVTGNETEKCFKQQRSIKMFSVLQRPQPHGEDQMNLLTWSIS